jgi:hypothetical protein
MESDSQPASYFQFIKAFLALSNKKTKTPPINVANLVGGAIAVLTLVLPLLAIARYSPSQVNLWQPTNYTAPR